MSPRAARGDNAGMRVFCYSPLDAFGRWDFRSPDGTGIGGSETCVCETARILAERGHEVTVYAPLRDGCPEYDRGGARWLPVAAADFTRPGLWVLHRCPAALDNFSLPHPGRTTWLVCQDVFYPPWLPDGLTPERSAKLDRCLPLCEDHERWLLEKNPELEGKTCRSGNGIRLDLIREVESEGAPERDPYRIIYTSSPDRGLASVLKVLRRVREFEPRVNLVAAYGFDNIDRCEGPHWRKVKAECLALMGQPNVRWLGRVPQRALYREFLQAGVWLYPTAFTETSCISCMEAQALGAVPVTNPLWALKDNVRHGVFLHGDPANDPLCRARYAGEVLRLARDHALQEAIRKDMVPWARQRFAWERVADDWEGWALGNRPPVSWYCQYAYQLRHAAGLVLNVGCNLDFARLGERGVNVDVNETDPLSGQRNAAHVVADARHFMPLAPGFDCAVLGDLLEHMSDADAVRVLRNSASLVRPGGKLVITCPEDHRPDERRGEYAPGVPLGHRGPVTRARLEGWLGEAGLTAERIDRLEYGFCEGHGAVAGVPACS